MVVNDNACLLAKRGVLESIASKLAPTRVIRCTQQLRVSTISVGASLLAMVVNDNAYLLAKRGVFESIASKLAPTRVSRCTQQLRVSKNQCRSELARDGR